jgi:hypothetical protein
MEAAVSIEVPAGPRLEGKLSVPEGSKAGLVLCHPHPLFPPRRGAPELARGLRPLLITGAAAEAEPAWPCLRRG